MNVTVEPHQMMLMLKGLSQALDSGFWVIGVAIFLGFIGGAFTLKACEYFLKEKGKDGTV